MGDFILLTLDDFMVSRIIFESGLYSSQDSIEISYLWIRTLFELGLYLSQASNNDSTVDVKYLPLVDIGFGFSGTSIL